MSGPKVVRVVTHEEKVAICKRGLAALSSSIASLLNYLREQGLTDEVLQLELKEKFEHYQTLAVPSNYREIPGLIEREIDYINAVLERKREQQLTASKFRQGRVRHLSESIKTLAILSAASGVNVDPQCGWEFSQLSSMSSSELEALEQKVRSELAQISIPTDENLSEEQKQLRNRLTQSGGELSVYEWKLIATESDKGNANVDRMDRVLAELYELGLPELELGQYLQQVDKIYQQESASQRALLLDSLVLALARKSTERQKLEDARQQLSRLKVEIEALEEDKTASILVKINAALNTDNISDVENMRTVATQFVAKLDSLRSVNSGRKLLVDALNSLGYQVHEGMQTAVVENGKLIVRKADDPIYGVEIQFIAATGRFQLRLVSGLSASERSTTDDVAEEEEWCADLAKLAILLSQSGSDLKIEKALDAGAVAVKHSAEMAELREKNARRSQNNNRELDH